MGKKNKKKEYNTRAVFAFFNVHEIESFGLTFEKVRLAACNTMHNQSLPYDQWCTVVSIKNSLNKSWDYNFAEKDVEFYFRRWWLDRAVNEFGLMIWNAVHKMHFNNWHQTGFLPKTDLPRKLRNNPEAVSSYIADQVTNDFLTKFH